MEPRLEITGAPVEGLLRANREPYDYIAISIVMLKNHRELLSKMIDSHPIQRPVCNLVFALIHGAPACPDRGHPVDR